MHSISSLICGIFLNEKAASLLILFACQYSSFWWPARPKLLVLVITNTIQPIRGAVHVVSVLQFEWHVRVWLPCM